jgi:hypothetical protein
MIKYDPVQLFAMLTDATRKAILNPARNDIPVPEGFDDAYNEALEREAQRAELEGLMICGDDEWGNR